MDPAFYNIPYSFKALLRSNSQEFSRHESEMIKNDLNQNGWQWQMEMTGHSETIISATYHNAEIFRQINRTSDTTDRWRQEERAKAFSRNFDIISASTAPSREPREFYNQTLGPVYGYVREDPPQLAVSEARAAKIRRLEEISFFGDKRAFDDSDTSLFEQTIARQIAIASGLPGIPPSEEQRRMVMAAVGLPSGLVPPPPASITIQDWANQRLGQPFEPAVPPSWNELATKFTTPAAPPPPPAKPALVHIRPGTRKIHRATP